ncbi:unnamed protein product [Rotaria magnacalcarata]|uniref:Reverse transcriptase domain-containing protein n=2 Tax=Rotaria magnacalcarata TaxID=392030 RepID=A0A816SJX9_9BILA|nr:unnamed protein product [Rotaria magnacalcarata]
MATENKHWTKEIIRRTKQRDEIVNNRFIKNKINQLALIMAQSSASISDLKTQLRTYWSQVPSYKGSKATIDALVQGTSTTTSSTTESTTSKIIATSLAPDRVRDKVDQVEKIIYKYLYHCTEHVKMSIENRIRLAKAQLDEFKALEEFQLASTPNHRIIHFVLKSKVKLWSTKNKNRTTILKRIELDLPPKWISKCAYNLKIDGSMISPQEVQEFYNRMGELKRKNRIEEMAIYQDIATREYELINNEINYIIIDLSRQTDEDEASSAALIHYHKLREKRLKLEAEQSVYFLSEQRAESVINNQEEEDDIEIIPPAYIRTPGRPVEQFIAALDKLLLKLHDSSSSNEKQQTTFNNNNNSVSTTTDNLPSQPSQLHMNNGTGIIMKKNRRNYDRLVKRLKYKFKLANVVVRKSDKSKVFHLGRLDEYNKNSNEYKEKTKAYKCLGTEDPLADLIQRTNKYLLDLRLIKWITQKQYEQLSIKPNEVELAHLYYLPKAHKPGTPLRPIVSELKHPTIKISKFLDQLLRPLFDLMASKTTVTSGFELAKYIQEWSKVNLRQDTLFCTLDVKDLYTMVPQIEGVLSLKKILDYLQLKQIDGLKIETIIRLSRFVMKNNYFSYDGQYYHQIRDGAMGSPLTLTMANCYMFFYEQQIIRQINNSGGLYFRYIDDIFITINWPARHLFKQIDRWNHFDENIKLSENIGSNVDFLDLHIENQEGKLFTTVYQKPSYEPYYLPFNSIHPLHMKKNIVFTMLLRAIRYCSTFQAYLNEREKLRMTLLMNKYPSKFLDEQFNDILLKLNIDRPLTFNNYTNYREKKMFVHFTYCSSMKTFPLKFHALWNEYFGQSPINEIIPVLGTRNVKNLQRRLTHTRSTDIDN